MANRKLRSSFLKKHSMLDITNYFKLVVTNHLMLVLLIFVRCAFVVIVVIAKSFNSPGIASLVVLGGL